MLNYIDFDFYSNVYKGESIDENYFVKLASLASASVNSVANFKIGRDLSALLDWQQEYVKLATACQVEHLNQSPVPISSLKIGEFSCNTGSNVSNKKNISYMVYPYLEAAGLFSRAL